jgi:hypothetical protein
MPANYPGNPAGGADTSPAPGRRNAPGANLPIDTDPPNAATFAPGYETALDWAAYFQRQQALNDSRGGGATSLNGPSNPTAWNDLLTNNGAPISALDVLPTFVAASGFAVTYGAGSGNVYTSVGIGTGESQYREVWWNSQNLTHANPHATLPRYDAVTVTPSAFGTASVLAVVTGTAASLPLAPAIPAGSEALFYVYVGAAVADSTHFRACRGLGRRVGYPWSGMSAVVAGCELSWKYDVNHATTPADVYVGAGDQTGTSFTVNRLLIDGEVIEWPGYLSNTTNNVVSDSTADPFASPASSSFDRPYYLYACGGRHNPLPSNTGTGILNPITVCESTVPPNPKTGKPTGNLTVNGVTVEPDGALYIGLGFVAQGTSLRRGCLMDNEMTCSLMPLQVLTHVFTTSGYEDIGNFNSGTPAISTKVRINALAGNASATVTTICAIKLNDVPSPGGLDALGPLAMYCGAVSGQNQGALNGVDVNFTPRTGAEFWAVHSGGSGSALTVAAMGFNHRVRRLVAGY